MLRDLSRVAVIVNPAAGRGRAIEAKPLVEQRLAAAGRRFDVLVTGGPGEAAKLSAQAIGRCDAVVAMGGDGTVNEVVNGLAGTGVPLGVIPLGSGNDFVKMVDIPVDVEAALQILLEGRPRSIDIGRVNDRIFVNSVGIGLDAAVARTMNRTRWLSGKAAYHYGVFRNILFYRNRYIRWSADGESGEIKSVLAAVMNGSTYGGDFKVAPEAVCDDGLLDLVIGGNYGPLSRVRVLPKFKRGRHLELPKIVWKKARRIEVESEFPLPVQVDGELLPETRTGTRVSIEVISDGLEVLTAPPGMKKSSALV